jgi:hypothetical protein
MKLNYFIDKGGTYLNGGLLLNQNFTTTSSDVMTTFLILKIFFWYGEFHRYALFLKK